MYRSTQEWIKSRSVQQWIALGVATVILSVIGYISRGNIAAIVNAEKDFLVGISFIIVWTLFLYAGVKNLRWEEAKNASVLIGANDPAIHPALRKHVKDVHVDTGMFRTAALLGRNQEATYIRISELYDMLSDAPTFYQVFDHLIVALGEIDQTSANIDALHIALGLEEAQHVDDLLSANKIDLAAITRDLREAINRRSQAYEILYPLHAPATQIRHDLFLVMSSDLFKAYRLLHELLSASHANEKMEVYLARIIEYIYACTTRAEELLCYYRSGQVEIPHIFSVMYNDVVSGRDRLAKIMGTQSRKSNGKREKIMGIFMPNNVKQELEKTKNAEEQEERTGEPGAPPDQE